ncbi:MAG: glycosyltransferase family 4 protein [Candidatus Micrarchaeia archaeon]|jgi:glycosyltransferase involved in cell wall biosynthesis
MIEHKHAEATPERESKAALFLITELERPVGGLSRFATELLASWKEAHARGKTEYEPIVLAMHDPALPLSDLVPAQKFAELTIAYPQLSVHKAERGGVTCYFLEVRMPVEEGNSFYGELYEKYRIRSERSSQDSYYRTLAAFWKYAPIVADFMQRKLNANIHVIDAQDWLAFPAGFLCREKLGQPLLCRFHSGEYGRSLGNPDAVSAPLDIEAAALATADFIQGVSISEMKFELFNLAGRKKQICAEVAPRMPQGWLALQEERDEKFEEFLLLESDGLEMVGEYCAGVPNGIILAPWKGVQLADIFKGREMLRGIFQKNGYVLFIGRPERRKGIDELLVAMGQLRAKDVGLVISSNMSGADYDALMARIRSMRLESSVAVHNGWLSDSAKRSLLCAADVVALPSLYEPFGLVTLEVLAADMACEENGTKGPVVIVGANGGMNEVIRNGVNGFKAPMASQFALRPDHLARIISMSCCDEALRARISKGGAERVQSPYFDWHYIVLRVHECYRRAGRNHSHQRAFYKKG